MCLHSCGSRAGGLAAGSSPSPMHRKLFGHRHVICVRDHSPPDSRLQHGTGGLSNWHVVINGPQLKCGIQFIWFLHQFLTCFPSTWTYPSQITFRKADSRGRVLPSRCPCPRQRCVARGVFTLQARHAVINPLFILHKDSGLKNGTQMFSLCVISSFKARERFSPQIYKVVKGD